MPDAELVVLRRFINQFDAEVARSALEAAGIDSMIRSDDCGGMRPHFWIRGIDLLVRSEDAERAGELLGAEARGLPQDDDAPPAGDP